MFFRSNINFSISMKDPNKLISFVVAFQVIAQGCKNILVQGFPFLYSINNMLNMVIMGGALLMYMYALFTTNKLHIPSQTIGILSFVGLTYFFTFTFCPQNAQFIQPTLLRTVVTCFLTFLLVSKLTTFEYLQKYFTNGSYLITLSGIMYAGIINIIGHSTTSDWSTYSMTMSNVLLLSVLWQLNGFFESKNKWALIASVIGTAVIFVYGSRNPFLAIVCFICIKVLLGEKRKQSLSSIVKFFFVTFSIVVLSFFKAILVLLATTLESFGLSSRTVYYLMNADAEDITTGRAEIHDKLWNFILDNPFVGHGVAGDEAVIDELAHSLYLSIYITYGLILGSIVILYLITMTIRGVRKTTGLSHSILVMYICLVFPRSFTGGDIWSNDYLWFMLALIMSVLYQRNKAVV